MAGGDHLRIEQKPSGRAIARPDGVGRPWHKGGQPRARKRVGGVPKWNPR